MSAWIVLAASLAYVSLLFAIAWLGDRGGTKRTSPLAKVLHSPFIARRGRSSDPSNARRPAVSISFSGIQSPLLTLSPVATARARRWRLSSQSPPSSA